MNEQVRPASPRHEDGEGREPAFNLPGVILALIALCAGLHALREWVLTIEQDIALLVRGAFIPARYSGEYLIDVWAWTSPLTYSLLHGGIAHLVINLVWLAAFGSPLANRIGALRFLVFWCFTALAAVGLHYALYPDSEIPLVGASGAISGMMGAAARLGFRIDRSRRLPVFGGPLLPIAAVLRMRTVVTFLAVWMVVNLVFGLYGGVPGEASTIAWEAHVGGFVAGFLAFLPFDRGLADA